ncbi:MAG: hypothetical protein ACE5FF_10800 [Saprospiraceae bacterium]
MRALLITPVLAIVLCFATFSNAQNAPSSPAKKKSIYPQRFFKGGQMDINLYAGALPTFIMDKAEVEIPPISIGASWLVSDHFGIDFIAGKSVSQSAKHYITDEAYATWRNNLTFAGVRPGVHFTNIDNLDIYGGMSLGVHISKIEGTPHGGLSDARLNEMMGHLGVKDKVSPAFSGFLGGRYALTSKMVISGEIGFNVSLISVGIGYRLF